MLNRKKFIQQAAMSAGAMLAGPSIMEAATYFNFKTDHFAY